MLLRAVATSVVDRGLKVTRFVEYELRTRLAGHARLHHVLPLLNRLGGGKGLAFLTDRTQLFVDGFPGSGNTAFFVTFAEAQKTPCVLGGHCHVSAQIVLAAERGIPTLVLIRQPADAVASLLSRWPRIGCRQALDSYVRFYAPLEALRGKVVIATFDEILSEVGNVVGAINECFNTTFDIPESLVRPSPISQQRSESKEEAQELLKQPGVQDRLHAAEEVFRRLSAASCLATS